MTVGGEDANRTRSVMEIRAGTGGDEAALFARDLYEMYKHHAESRGWKVEMLDMNATELGGFKEVILGVEGEGAYRELQYESGGHRVQRVPETETKGRLQTSVATVAVLPEPEDVEIDLKPDEYRKDVFCASGPGGQHVNKTASAIRLTHYETGIVVSCQDEKSQHKNFAKALRVLKTRLYEHKRQNRARQAGQRTQNARRLGRSQRTHSHLQLPRKSGHRSPHQPDALQARLDPGRQPATGDRSPDGLRPPTAARRYGHGRVSLRFVGAACRKPKPGPSADCWPGPPTISSSTDRESPRLDAEVLLASAAGCQRIELYTRFDEPAADESAARGSATWCAAGPRECPSPIWSADGSSIRSRFASRPTC